VDNMQLTVAERLSWAMQPGSLKLIRGPSIGRAEYLIALGWVGIHHRTASAIYRMVHSMDGRRYADTLRMVEMLVSHLAARRRWDCKPHHHRKIAKDALDFVLHPTCPHCEGRGYEVVPGSGRLSDRVCHSCGGAGRRPVSTRRLAEVISELESSEDIITRGVVRRVSGEAAR
jgi:hypothetical protein